MTVRRLIRPLLIVGLTAALAMPAHRGVASEVEAVRIDVGGYRLNSVLLQPGARADLPPIVFIHGASSSLYDQLLCFRDRLEGRAALLFVDRPGHGASDTGGARNILPDGQADAISVLMERRGIDRAVIVGHSFGGAIAAAFAVRHPEKLVGLAFLSPAVYPWSTGIDWYYDIARTPVIGHVFSALVVPPLGFAAIEGAADAVFAPNRRPDDYVRKTHALQAISPGRFRHNAQEIAALSDWAKVASRDYPDIKAPTVIITGDADKIVSPEIHSRHLARDIRGSQLIVVHNLGHKPDYVAGDLVVAAIERVAGRKLDLQAIARSVEKRIADDGKD